MLPEKVQDRSASVLPAVVVTLATLDVSLETIKNTFTRFAIEDDVFHEDFTTGGYLLLQGASSRPTPSLPADIADYLAARSIVMLHLDSTLPQGPYFARGRQLHQAWRLYPDFLSAFTTIVVPEEANSGKNGPVEQARYFKKASHVSSKNKILISRRFQAFHTAAFIESVSAVPVPSRLYDQKSPDRPLAGMRISIKDNMHLAGITTTLGSRSYTELYGKQEASSEYVDLLICKGAVIVGKTKLSAFAGSEIPPNQCIDYFPPWNPRGDGYQGPSGSSSGAAASVAGYSWLDVALCTDSTCPSNVESKRSDVLGLTTNYSHRKHAAPSIIARHLGQSSHLGKASHERSRPRRPVGRIPLLARTGSAEIF